MEQVAEDRRRPSAYRRKLWPTEVLSVTVTIGPLSIKKGTILEEMAVQMPKIELRRQCHDIKFFRYRH